MRSACLPAGLILLVLAAACQNEEEVLEEPAGTPAATAAPATPAVTPAANAEPTPTPAAVLTYTDPTFGYSFDYPAGWYLSPEKGGSVILYSYDPAKVPPEEAGMPVPKDKLKAIFHVVQGVEKPLDQWLAESRNQPGQPPPPEVLSTWDITLGGKSGIAELVDDGGQQSVGYYIGLAGGWVFAIGSGPADSQVWGQFEKLLASIQFAE